MNTLLTKTQLSRYVVLAVALVCAPMGLQAGPFFTRDVTKVELRFWNAVYAELHPGETPQWSALEGPREWASKQSESLEPIVVRIIKGQSAQIPWTQGLYGAKILPTRSVCDAAWMRAQRLMDEARRDGDITVAEHTSLAPIVEVLAAGGDLRASEAANELVQSLECPREISRVYIEALRKTGDAQSVAVLRTLRLRRKDPGIDREAGLAEKVITARLAGEKPTPDAQRELQDLARRLVDAVDKSDYPAYMALLPFGFADVESEQEVSREIFGNTDVLNIIGALKRDMEKPFEVQADGLEGVLRFGDGHTLECVLEVDGWKVRNLR